MPTDPIPSPVTPKKKAGPGELRRLIADADALESLADRGHELSDAIAVAHEAINDFLADRMISIADLWQAALSLCDPTFPEGEQDAWRRLRLAVVKMEAGDD